MDRSGKVFWTAKGGWVQAGVWILAILAGGVLQAQTEQVDPKLPDYEKVSGVSGNLVGIGSDTLNIMMDMWLKEFQKIYPTVTGAYRGEGSSTAPPALIEGAAQLGPMSRAMKPEELDKFEKRFGYKPLQIVVAIDCLAVYVHKDNPIKGLTLPQVDAIFSSTRKLGHSTDIRTWGEAGLTDPAWANLPISLYGRNSVSGTYAFFKEHALGKGDFKDTVKEQPGSAGVIHGVANERAAIGYSGIGYRTADVRSVPLAKSAGGAFVEPTFENALKGQYPLARSLYIYVNKKPNEPLPVLVAEFLKFVLSKQGQQIVVKDGFGPLPLKIIQRERQKLQ
ncbi:MAG TPA: phosphate ABC transporter substrate-binding protein [Thermoguttaceae bacterium]|nr:phosphate ABC transporter substrate-binding protein [Thermoguttaceae bacterium]